MRRFLPALGALLGFGVLLLGVIYSVLSPQSSSSTAPSDIVLYDQYDHPSYGAIPSLRWLESGEWLQAADDFVVPNDQNWVIQQIEVPGQYYNGADPAQSFNVTIYSDVEGRPGSVVFTETQFSYATPAPDAFPLWMTPNTEATEIPYTEVAQGSLIIPISSLVLPSGTYWLSVQGNTTYAYGGWSWQERLVVANQAAKSRQSTGGCPNWNDPAVCQGYLSGQDQLFRLVGSIATNSSPSPVAVTTTIPAPLPTSTPPPLPLPSATATLVAAALTPTESGVPTDTATPLPLNSPVPTGTMAVPEGTTTPSLDPATVTPSGEAGEAADSTPLWPGDIGTPHRSIPTEAPTPVAPNDPS